MAMQMVRFFEDRRGRGGARRLLLGVATCEVAWEVDGGRREAVKTATMEDARRYPQAYREYYTAFPDAGEPPPQPAPDHPVA